MNREESMLRKRLIDLSDRAYQRDIVVFSDFLNLNELNILHTTPKDQLSAKYRTYGGYESAERQMIAFLPDALYYEYEYPIRMLEIAPLNGKFCEELTHRDYLGSVMNLGLDRSKFGDILVDGKTAYVFACEDIAPYTAEHLTRIRHTSVVTTVRDIRDIHYEPKYQEIKGTVPSIRLDTVLSVAFPLSRSRLTAHIEAGKVFVNGKLITSNGYHLNEGDLISVRGLGKAAYGGILSETKKGRYLITVRKYV